MKKFFVFIVGLFVVGTVFAVGENIPTSKTYVDNAVAQKQNTISANNGNAQVLTNTGTAGTIGTKNIYDSSAAYETQTNSLVTASTMNTAVQNAIESEFVCIEYDANNECLLLEIRKSALPNGYTQLEYIESTGTQYIDTGINFGVSIGYRLVFRPSTLNIFVTSTNTIGGDLGQLIAQNTGMWECRTLSGTITTNQAVDISNFVALAYNINHNCSIGDKNFSLNGYDLNDNGKIFVPGQLADWNSISGRGDIKYIQIYDNDNPVRNFIPARRDSDGEVGMYDAVTNTFFTNSGTGEFIAGPVFSYLPQN